MASPSLPIKEMYARRHGRVHVRRHGESDGLEAGTGSSPTERPRHTNDVVPAERGQGDVHVGFRQGAAQESDPFCLWPLVGEPPPPSSRGRAQVGRFIVCHKGGGEVFTSPLASLKMVGARGHTEGICNIPVTLRVALQPILYPDTRFPFS